MVGKTIAEMKVGDTAEFRKTISESDIYLFAGITGDFNPFHVNEEYAKQTFFKGRMRMASCLRASYRRPSVVTFQVLEQFTLNKISYF